MAKRYHQSKRDRRDERMGMDRYYKEKDEAFEKDSIRNPIRNPERDRGVSFGGVRHRQPEFNDSHQNAQDDDRPLYNDFRLYGNEFYAGMEPRRRQEMQDAGYIREDNDAVANLPQGVIMRPYAKTGPYMPEGLDDSIDGVDNQMYQDDNGRRKHFLPKKV